MSMTTEPSVEDRLMGLLASDEEAIEEAPETEEELSDDGQAEDDAEPEADDEAEGEAEETDDEDDEEGDDAEPVGAITIEIDGQTRTLTAEEVRDGVLMRSDYTRKTQQLSEEKKAFESERQQFAEWAQNQARMMQQFQDPEPDWDKLYEEDPIGAPKIERDYRVKQQQRYQVLQEQQAEAQRAMQQRLAQEAARLPELIPEWSDPKAAEAEMAEVRDTLKSVGFTDEEIGGVNDARLVKMLVTAHRAMKSEKARSGVVQKKVAGKPKVVKPGSAAPKKSAKSRINDARSVARKTQSPDAWNKVFENFV